MSSDQINSVFAAQAIIDAKEQSDIASLQSKVSAAGVFTGQTATFAATTNQITLGSYPNQTVMSYPANGSGVRTYSSYDTLADCKTLMGIAPTKAVSGATTLTAADSGSVVHLTQTSAYTVILPPLAVGLRFKFINVSPGSFAINIDTLSAATMKGSVLVSAGAAATSAVLLGQRQVVFASGSLIGDWVEVYSNGVFWFADGRSTAAAGLASAA